MTRRSIPALVAAAFAGCGGPILFAELELPDVEGTLPQYTFPGDPLGLSTATDVAFDVGANVPALTDPNVELEVRLTRMTLVLDTSGPLSSFDGFQTVTISALHPSGDPARDVVLLEYVKPAGATGITRITATSETDADLEPFLVDGVIDLRAAYQSDGVNPTLPTADWTADLSAELRLQARLDYGAYL